MSTWSSFIFFALAAVVLWVGGALLSWRGRRVPAVAATVGGIAVFLAYIIVLWVSLERPPMRTMGETRLWYALFLPLAGLFVYGRWHYRWILPFSTVMATVFVCINLFKPEIHSKMLMPALQSPWFAPHVIVYMFAYAMLGASFLMAVWMLLFPKPAKERTEGRRRFLHPSEESGEALDNLVYVGLAFMTVGMLFGALWAKEAWGHYWSWDPKETWAAATWLAYLCYIHYRRYPRHSLRTALWMLVVCFLLLQMCWWGINYLPSAQQTSVHTYNM